MAHRTQVWSAIALLVLATQLGSEVAFDPQPDPPQPKSIREKVHLPIYDAISIERPGA
jgi:hypothetical protein